MEPAAASNGSCRTTLSLLAHDALRTLGLLDPLRVAFLVGEVAVAARRAGRALVRTDVALVLVARAELFVADQALVILADRHARASPRLLPTKVYDLGYE